MSAHGPDYNSRSLLAGLRASAVIDKAKEKTMTLPSQSAGHTLGPWDFKFPTVNGVMIPGTDCQVLHNGFLIANVAQGGMFGTSEQVIQQKEANARLIARAPDLLAENSKLKGQLEEAVAALKDAASAIDYVSTFVPADEPITEHNENCIAAVARFNALLSKLKEAGL